MVTGGIERKVRLRPAWGSARASGCGSDKARLLSLMQPTKAGRQCLRALEVFNGSENGQATTICAHKPEAEAEAEEDEEDGRVTTKHVAA